MALTAKQERFVAEYLIDLNATQAAIRAGYSEKTANEQGSRLLANVKIASAVAEAQAKRSERTHITQDMVLAEIAKIGFSDLRKAVAWSGQTVTLKNSEELDDDTAAAVSEVALTQSGLRIKMHDKLSALEKLGKHLGMFGGEGGGDGDVPRLNINITSDAPVRDVRVTRSEG
jgi:phage terminase small subunit